MKDGTHAWISFENTSSQCQRLGGMDEWTYVHNCSFYAVNVWAVSGGTNVNAGIIATHKTLGNNIIKTPGYETNGSVTRCDSAYYKATNPVKFTFR